MKELSRWTYLRGFTAWWGLVVAIYSLAGLYDLICGQFIDDAPRFGDIAASGNVPWYVWPLGLLTILLVLTFEGGYRQYRALQRRLAEVPSPYDSVVSELARESYQVGGEHKSGDELFVKLAPLFREAISEGQLQFYFENKIRLSKQTKAGTAPISGEEADWISKREASRVLSNWFPMDLLDAETRDPAPGATSSIRTSRHDFPYSVYRLSAHGKAVFQHLKKRSQQPATER